MTKEMSDLLLALAGGDRRSVRGVPRVVRRVLAEPALFRIVFDGMTDDDPLIRMRCADAVEKITSVRPEYLIPYKARVLRLAAAAEQREVRWHLAQLMSRLRLSPPERRRAVTLLTAYLGDGSRIVKTCAMQALADIAARDRSLRAPIVRRLRSLTRTGSPAMSSRGRRLLAELRGAGAARDAR